MIYAINIEALGIWIDTLFVAVAAILARFGYKIVKDTGTSMEDVTRQEFSLVVERLEAIETRLNDNVEPQVAAIANAVVTNDN